MTILGGGGLSYTISGGDIPPNQRLDGRVIVKNASDLSGTLDSTKEYFIDGIIDMGTQSVEIPVGGLYLTGYNFDTSQLISSENNYTMFTSPVGGSGNVLGRDFALTASGTDSKVYDISGNTGFEAIEFYRVNYNDCTSLGTIDNYRQGLESGTGRFGGTPQLTLSGTWLGGFFIDTSIVRGLQSGSYSLFSAGTGFVMNSRFRSNANIDLPTGASFVDFSSSNFPNPSTLQFQGCIVTRNGSTDPDDPLITPNISKAELPCDWNNNQGMDNTYEGGKQTVTSEATTPINSAGQYELLLGTYTPTDLEHFDSPSNGQLRHIGVDPRNYNLYIDAIIDGGPNDAISLRVRKFKFSNSTFSTVAEQTRTVNSLLGGRDVAFFNLLDGVELDQNDYIFLEVANLTDTTNVAIENGSYFRLTER